MKTKIIIFLLLLSSSVMFAQPWMTGGNAAASGDYLGTNNNQPLLFHTFGVERAHINPNRTQTILGYTFNADGYMGLGENSICPGGDCLDGTNHSLDTDATANFPLQIMTNGINRMHINCTLFSVT